MKLTAQQVFDSTLTLAQIIRDKRPMPQKGKWLISRMHTKLLAEFNPISEQRDELIKGYDTHPLTQRMANPDGPVEVITDNNQYIVPEDKIDEFKAAWAEIAKTELEVDVQPIPVDTLCLADGANGGIEAVELQSLGELVME